MGLFAFRRLRAASSEAASPAVIEQPVALELPAPEPVKKPRGRKAQGQLREQEASAE